MAQRKMMYLTPFFLIVLLPSYKVYGLTLTVKTSYFEIGGSGVTLECNLDGATWDVNTSPRLWSVPPNLLTAIRDGSESPGYTEDLSDVATSGIFRMITPELDWSIENQLFQCTYLFATANLNATRSILSRNSGSSVTYDDSAKTCVFTISEILPLPSKVITLEKNSKRSDISTDFSRVTETLTNNSGQTYSYRLEVSSEGLNDGDNVIFQVTAGPYSMNETCTITESKGLSGGVIAAIVICSIVAVAGIVVAIGLGLKKKYPCQKGSPKKEPDSGNSGDKKIERPSKVDEKNTKPLSPATLALTNEAKPGGRALPPIPQHEKKKKTPRKKKKRVKTEDGEDTEKLPSIQKKERNIEHYTRDTQDPES